MKHSHQPIDSFYPIHKALLVFCIVVPLLLVAEVTFPVHATDRRQFFRDYSLIIYKKRHTNSIHK